MAKNLRDSAAGASKYGLSIHGIAPGMPAYWNLPAARLYEESIKRNEAVISAEGPLVVKTGQYTGRSPNDKFIVDEPSSTQNVWWGKVNRPIPGDMFDKIRDRLITYLSGQELFVQDCFVGSDPEYRLPIRLISQYAWHSLFGRNMFLPVGPEEASEHSPEFTIFQIPGFETLPETEGTNSEAVIALNFGSREVIIGGTAYAGEAKKSVFSVMNYLLPLQGVLPMHCSANRGSRGDVAIFFGLSGTGKTTLSVTADRELIGDDEHGWSDNGVFNFEGGCYAKVIKLSQEAEPEIYKTTREFGTVLENVVIDGDSRVIDLDDDSLTENTRGSFSISQLSNATLDGVGGHPENIIMLTADAFGVLPPISRLTPEQAMYHFLSGYTARVAGTERGVVEPQATFSPCFGAPFMALHPTVYGNLLREKIEKHGSSVWLVNTGWTGGPYGVGSRMKIAYTRAMIQAALNGSLQDVPTYIDPVFRVQIPEQCPGVPDEVLNPRNTWSDKSAYDEQAKKLARLFADNFKEFESQASSQVLAAAPIVS